MNYNKQLLTLDTLKRINKFKYWFRENDICEYIFRSYWRSVNKTIFNNLNKS